MHTLRHFDVSIRSQASLVLALTALWCGSFFGWIFEMDSTRLWWTASFIFLPFVMLAFGVILFVSHRKTNQRPSWLVHFALLAAVSPWLILLLIFLGHVL
jgi:hypothetical protein